MGHDWNRALVTKQAAQGPAVAPFIRRRLLRRDREVIELRPVPTCSDGEHSVRVGSVGYGGQRLSIESDRDLVCLESKLAVVPFACKHGHRTGGQFTSGGFVGGG